MTKPTTEQLQSELQDIVNKHSQAKQVIAQCEKRFIELTAIIKDRTTTDSDAT